MQWYSQPFTASYSRSPTTHRRDSVKTSLLHILRQHVASFMKRTCASCSYHYVVLGISMTVHFEGHISPCLINGCHLWNFTAHKRAIPRSSLPFLYQDSTVESRICVGAAVLSSYNRTMWREAVAGRHYNSSSSRTSSICHYQ